MNQVLKNDSTHMDKKRRQWHPAFFGAMHLELKENKEDLEFTEEKILNTMPL